MQKETNMDKEKLVSALFQTEAVKVCDREKPFWYTSGTLGPYFINTHYLYGNAQKAQELLNYIDASQQQRTELTGRVFSMAMENYQKDAMYRRVMDDLVTVIQENEKDTAFDYISGGERRDWFFSVLAAYLLNKPHITIYKDMEASLWDGESELKLISGSLAGKKVLHIADLITEASSFERAWVPVIQGLGATMCSTYVIVDRQQGGKSVLATLGVSMHALLNIDIDLFENALAAGFIESGQFEMVSDYIENPYKTMRKFLQKHPEFLVLSLQADAKTRERAKLCIEKNIYGIQF